MNNKLTDQWSSKWAFVLAATGAAVGLGNVWRFPYMAGTNGGSAFTLMYVLCVLLIGLPIMAAEILIGRRARQNPVSAMQTLAIAEGRSKHWGLVGWWGALALLLILSFYSVVAGWAVAYLCKSIFGTFNNLEPTEITHVWNNFLANPWQLLAWHSIFMCLTIGVIIRGVQQGLEKATKYMMPALYVILIILVIYSGMTGAFSKAFHFLFDFDRSKLTTSIFIVAMGHAFFTLALGAGAMLAYGAYVPRSVNIFSSIAIVAVLDVLVAFLSGLAIFPIVFAHHLSPTSGPGLMFITLPIAFAHLPGGALIGGLFFILLIFAAWTSSINLAEPMVMILMQRCKINRTPAALLVGALAWFLGIGSVLSFNVWQNVRVLHRFTVFDVATSLPMDIILPIGGFCFAVFAGWIMSKQATRDELKSKIYPLWRFLCRYVATIGILVVFLSPLLS